MSKTTPTPPTPEEVARAARALGRELEVRQAHLLAAYLGLLQAWNARTNLVGPRAWPLMLSELVADSWWLADLLAELPGLVPGFAPNCATGLAPDSGSGLARPDAGVWRPRTLDFGAGAGIPGVPLRMFWQAGSYLLIEPRAKRAGFLRQCLAMTRLPRTEVLEGRTDQAGDQADICLSRAFQPWPRFLETAAGFRPCWAGGPDFRGGVIGRSAGEGLNAGDDPDAAGGQNGMSDQNAGGEQVAGGDQVAGGGPARRARPLAVVFATREAPEEPIPAGYALAVSRPYPSRGGVGWFWVFA